MLRFLISRTNHLPNSKGIEGKDARIDPLESAVARAVGGTRQRPPQPIDPELRITIAHFSDRRRSTAATLQLAAVDNAFHMMVAEADVHRDSGRWGAGEHAYFRALQVYPLHAGYRVQYGHCLKEQSKFSDAEVQYRSAMALGNRDPDLLRHLRFVTEKAGRSLSVGWLGAVEDYWARSNADSRPLAAPATQQDVLHLSQLFLGHTSWPIAEVALLLDSAPRQCDVAVELISLPGFVHANRDLVTLIAETIGPK